MTWPTAEHYFQAQKFADRGYQGRIAMVMRKAVATSKDKYWGEGEDGTGKNMLGKILMEVRAELRQLWAEK